MILDRHGQLLKQHELVISTILGLRDPVLTPEEEAKFSTTGWEWETGEFKVEAEDD